MTINLTRPGAWVRTVLSCAVVVVLGGATITGAVFASVDEGLSALEAGETGAAAEKFEEAFKAGEPDGYFYLGRLFELGIGTQSDLARAAVFYSQAAEAGSVPARNRYGLMLLRGEGTIRDYVRGTEMVCAAAEAGDARGPLGVRWPADARHADV